MGFRVQRRICIGSIPTGERAVLSCSIPSWQMRCCCALSWRFVRVWVGSCQEHGVYIYIYIYTDSLNIHLLRSTVLAEGYAATHESFVVRGFASLLPYTASLTVSSVRGGAIDEGLPLCASFSNLDRLNCRHAAWLIGLVLTMHVRLAVLAVYGCVIPADE